MLVAVGTVVTITNVLSATTQYASASFTITYEANNVNATVAVASKKQSQSNYTNATSNVSRTFYATNPTIQDVTLSANELALGFDKGNTVFERYAVYRFTFTNNNGNGGKGLDVSATFTPSNSMSNVALLWIATSAVLTTSLATNPIATPSVTPPGDDAENWPAYTNTTTTHSVTPNNSGNFTVASNIGAGYSMCLFLFVAISKISLPITFTLGGQGNSSLSFTLTSHANT